MPDIFSEQSISALTKTARRHRKTHYPVSKITKPAGEREHEFALVLTGVSKLTPELTNALFEAGCDDATPSIRSGRMYLTFSRQAPSVKDAIFGAIRDVKKANIGLEVLRIDECDLVTQSDIARRIHRSRQLVNQYISGERGPGDFPAPACELHAKHPLWMWCEVTNWLYENNLIKEDALSDSREKYVINTILELHAHHQQRPELTHEALDALGIDLRDYAI